MSGWQRLGRRVTAERSRRRWSVQHLAAIADLSIRTIEYIEGGTRDGYRQSTLARIEDAFGWTPGSCERIVEGGQPRRTQDHLLARIHDRWAYLTTAQQQAIVELLETFSRQR